MEPESTILLRAVTAEAEELHRYKNFPGVQDAIARLVVSAACLPATEENLRLLIDAVYCIGVHIGRQARTLERMGL